MKISGPVGRGAARLVGIDIAKLDERQLSFPLEISMPYFGELSCNHYQWQNRRKKNLVKQWMNDLEDSVRVALSLPNDIDTKNPTVEIAGCFKDKRCTPDMHNLIKVTLDSVARALNINDRDIKVQTGIPIIKKANYGIFFFKRGKGQDCLEAKGELRIKIR